MRRLDFFWDFGRLQEALLPRKENEMSYFIGFCVNNLENDGSPEEPVQIPVEATTDEEGVKAFDAWKKAHKVDYNDLPYVERPRLYQTKLVAE